MLDFIFSKPVRLLLFVFFVSGIPNPAICDEKTAEERRKDRREQFPIVRRAEAMVENELLPQGGLDNPDVIDVMKRIPRHRFVMPLHQSIAYRDTAIAIGEAQTISPPYIVAFMTERLDPKPTDKVLEIGTGSGYQAAVLSLLVDEVYSIEIVEPLGKRSEKLLQRLGMNNVHVRVGDGYKGWPEAAPFDSIIVTCSPETVPQPLIDQLREGGRMIIPLGERYQQAFYLCRKIDGKLVNEQLTQTLFVPMTGQAEERREVKPDPNNPSIIGGNFEETRADGSPVGWHYARNVRIVRYEETDSRHPKRQVNPETAIPEGDRFARFVSEANEQPESQPAPVRQSPRNRKPSTLPESEPKKFAQILQGIAVDGRNVKTLALEFSMRGENIRPRPNRFQTPVAVLMLYDEDRNQISEITAGRCDGSFDWRRVVHEMTIPEQVREAVLLIGLPAATGRLDVDGIVVRAVEKTE